MYWRPQGDLNPRYRRERAVSWTGLDDGDEPKSKAPTNKEEELYLFFSKIASRLFFRFYFHPTGKGGDKKVLDISLLFQGFCLFAGFFPAVKKS